MTDPELKEIAEGIVGGKIFTDRHLRTPEDLRMVFPILGMMDEEQVKATAEKIGTNGMIYTFSASSLVRTPHEKNIGQPLTPIGDALLMASWDYHDKIKAAIEAVG